MSVRDIPAYKLRMKPQLRERLEKEAAINGRSFHAELLNRLEASLSLQDAVQKRGYSSKGKVAEPSNDSTAISDSERAMLAMFRRWGPEKQLALLSLFK